MIALVNRADCTLPAWADGQFSHVLDRECPLCKKVTYQLWVPTAYEIEPGNESELRNYLFQTVIESCPKHRDFYYQADNHSI